MSYDGIILGSGHNALVLACYAARAGLKVAVVEKNSVAGGGLATVEFPTGSGFRHNTHSFFHRGLTAMPWYRDLELERHGLRYLEPELNVAMLLPEDRVLEWWTDFEKTHASFAAISPRDADRLREWTERFRPIVEQILIPEAQHAPLPSAERLAKLKQTELGRTLLETQALSPLEFVMREFEHPAVRAGLLFFNGLREVDLRQQGFGHSIPSLLASPRKAQMCVGGSGQLAEALCADLREHGGDIFTNWQPRSILTRDGRACGVESTTGDRIEGSRFVASGLNPQQTFLDLIPAAVASSHLRERAANFEYNLLAPLFALNLNLREPPRYTAAETHPELSQAFMMILGLDDVAQFHDIVTAHERGEIPRTVMWGACPTQFDPSQPPQGSTPPSCGKNCPMPCVAMPTIGITPKRSMDATCSHSGNRMHRTCARPCSAPSPAARSTPNACCQTCCVVIYSSDPSRTIRLAIIAPLKEWVPTARKSPASTSAAAPPIRAATSPACAVSMPRRCCWRTAAFDEESLQRFDLLPCLRTAGHAKVFEPAGDEFVDEELPRFTEVVERHARPWMTTLLIIVVPVTARIRDEVGAVVRVLFGADGGQTFRQHSLCGETGLDVSEVDPVLRPGLREVKLWDHGVGR